MNDVIQHQRLASGFLNAATDPTLAGAVLENCTVARTVSIGTGSFDITIGGNGPSPVGIGGVGGPPAVVNQGRSVVTVRGPTNVRLDGVVYGASLSPPLPQVVRLTFKSVGASPVLADADFDFSIERVISPAQEP